MGAFRRPAMVQHGSLLLSVVLRAALRRARNFFNYFASDATEPAVAARCSAGPAERRCQLCGGAAALTNDDMDAVVARLGIVIFGGAAAPASNGGGGCQACELMESAEELLEEKTATMSELEAAFRVFDRNGDGFICAAELWNVMRRLGVAQGAGYDDCTRMIGAFDGDGDGRISFPEFATMMELAS